MAGDNANQPPRKRRPASSAEDRLRNLYQTGDESGRKRPDEGETFAGLRRRKKRFEDEQ
jgi:hypothetical protein